MIREYRRKPHDTSREGIRVARYEPGHLEDLDDLGKEIYGFDVTEVMIGGQPAALVVHTEVPDYHPSYEDFDVIRPGHYMGTGGISELFITDDDDLRQFYDEVPQK